MLTLANAQRKCAVLGDGPGRLARTAQAFCRREILLPDRRRQLGRLRANLLRFPFLPVLLELGLGHGSMVLADHAKDWGSHALAAGHWAELPRWALPLRRDGRGKWRRRRRWWSARPALLRDAECARQCGLDARDGGSLDGGGDLAGEGFNKGGDVRGDVGHWRFLLGFVGAYRRRQEWSGQPDARSTRRRG
jgi:hypothetical protein